MATKKITDLQLGTASDDMNVAADNSIQTYRITFLQIANYVKTFLANVLVPTGTVYDFAGAEANVPTGYLLCYGQNVSRTTYAALFALIGTTYGAGDGSTTFGLPDLRGRVVAGKDNMGGSTASRLTNAASGITGTTLGASGGNETHTLTTAQMPTHTHIQNSHVHVQNRGQTGSTVTLTVGSGQWDSSPTSAGYNTQSATAVNQTEGSGNAHNNTQPTFILNKIIKT